MFGVLSLNNTLKAQQESGGGLANEGSENGVNFKILQRRQSVSEFI